MEFRLNNDKTQLLLKIPFIELPATSTIPFECDNHSWVTPIPDQNSKNWLITAAKTLGFAPLHELFMDLICKTVRELKRAKNITQDWSHTIKYKLLPHQETGVQFIHDHPRCMLACDLGLGKTLMALAFLSHMNYSKSLIVVPSALQHNWSNEIIKFTHMTFNNPVSKKKFLQIGSFAKILLLSYDIMRTCAKELQNEQWDCIVCDEAHLLKHEKTKRSRVLAQLSTNTKRVILLTGTPAHKSMYMWNLLRILDNRIFAQFYTKIPPRNMKQIPKESTKFFYFADRWVHVHVAPIGYGRFIYNFGQSKNKKELRALSTPYVLRQKLKNCISLPPLLQEQVIICEPSVTQQKYIQDGLTKWKTLVGHEADQQLMSLVRWTNSHKHKHILQYILEQLKIHKQQFIVFVYYHECGEYLDKHLTELNIPHIFVYGLTSEAQRKIKLDSFQADKGIRVAILSMGVCSTGMNFTFVNLVLYAELSFDAVQQSQSFGRCHRIGQMKPVVLQFLMMKNSTDQILFQSLKSKLQTAEEILDS